MNFKDQLYFPIIRTRQAELNGYARLSDETKDNLCPLITLGKWRNSEDCEKAIAKISECVGNRNYILDLTRDLQHQNQAVRELMNPDSNFSNWVEFVRNNENIIPTVQLTQGAKGREIVRQAVALENLSRPPVFRIKDFKSDLDNTLSALYALNNPENALIIIDAGYIRDISTKNIKPGVLESILRTINRIVDEIPEVPRVLAGTSFPRSVTPWLNEESEKSGKIDILENILFDEIGSDIVMYGDHVSIHSVVYDDEGGTFLPRLDVPSDGFWHFERRPKTKSEGYIDAANTLLENHPEFQESNTWGAEMLRNTANASGTTINAPVTAIAVRVNLHIDYQIKLLNDAPQLVEDDNWIF
ncbi:beta family protein [Pseudomonas chlororaphis]|uniref:beta family protein n=1 Tax=Pseudomonas chlororaphis TaxID=587753 RepID=UPI001CF589BC|nr:beta family protein [Pseudomonas chlororaphis]UCR87199.1 beta family protein [Pseudomonas chlororaphis]